MDANVAFWYPIPPFQLSQPNPILFPLSLFSYLTHAHRLTTSFLALEHCIELMRQNLMYNAGLNIIPHHWIKQSLDPFANLNTWLECRDIGAVEKRIEEDAISEVEGEWSLPGTEGDTPLGEPP